MLKAATNVMWHLSIEPTKLRDALLGLFKAHSGVPVTNGATFVYLRRSHSNANLFLRCTGDDHQRWNDDGFKTEFVSQMLTNRGCMLAVDLCVAITVLNKDWYRHERYGVVYDCFKCWDSSMYVSISSFICSIIDQRITTLDDLTNATLANEIVNAIELRYYDLVKEFYSTNWMAKQLGLVYF